MKKLLAAVVLALPIAAQTHSESITVEVVDVPVYVYNSNGALQNLTKNDFQLFVNGTRSWRPLFAVNVATEK